MIASSIVYFIWKFSALTELPGVLWVLPDSYMDIKNKDYGGVWTTLSLLVFLKKILFLSLTLVVANNFVWISGDKFVDGKVIPRPEFRFIKSENKEKEEGENDSRYKGRPPRSRQRDEDNMPPLRHNNRNKGRRPWIAMPHLQVVRRWNRICQPSHDKNKLFWGNIVKTFVVVYFVIFIDELTYSCSWTAVNEDFS